MTSLIERSKLTPAKRPKGATASLGAPELPQVDLLPPEIRAGRGLAVVKRWLVIGLLATLVLAALVYGWAFLQRQSAEDHLAEAQDTATRQIKEKATYSEVTDVIKGISDTRTAIAFGSMTTVRWSPYLDAIAAVLPQDVVIETFTIAQGSPTSPFVDAADPLNTQLGIGSIRFTSRSATLPVASEWLDALESIPGFVDPSLQSSLMEEEDGTSYYSVSSTIQVDATATELFRSLAVEGE